MRKTKIEIFFEDLKEALEEKDLCLIYFIDKEGKKSFIQTDNKQVNKIYNAMKTIKNGNGLLIKNNDFDYKISILSKEIGKYKTEKILKKESLKNYIKG